VGLGTPQLEKRNASHKQSVAVHDTHIRNGDIPSPSSILTASESEETGRDSGNSVQARKVSVVCEGDGDRAYGRQPLHRAAPNSVDRGGGGLVPGPAAAWR
jgi:hypothetical protein